MGEGGELRKQKSCVLTWPTAHGEDSSFAVRSVSISEKLLAVKP